MDPRAQAAWLQGIVSILALFVAISIPYWQKKRERDDKAVTDRKIVMSAAATLFVALDHESMIIEFAPAGDGKVGHDMTLDQAREFMKLEPETREALKIAIDKSHYFSEQVCGHIVRLGIEAAAYERFVEETARFTPNANVDVFFQQMQDRKNKFRTRIEEVRESLREYLPAN